MLTWAGTRLAGCVYDALWQHPPGGLCSLDMLFRRCGRHIIWSGERCRIAMDASLPHLLSELEEAGRRYDEQEQDRSRKTLTLDPETAHLLTVLAGSSQPTRPLEIGTSNGTSTTWW